jgi:hypothetical protein
VLQWSLYCAYNIRLERCIHYDFGMHPLQLTDKPADVAADTPGESNGTGAVTSSTASRNLGKLAHVILSSSPGVEYCPRVELGCTAFVPAVSHTDLVLRSLLPSSESPRDACGEL